MDVFSPSFDICSAFELSSETIISVELVIITGPEGLVEITTRSTLLPITLIGIVSPFVINVPFKYSERNSSAPIILRGSIGAKVILLASLDSTTLISTKSLMPTSNLFLISPSIRIRPLSLSLSFAGQLRTVVFLPSDVISNASPLVMLMRFAIAGSMRAIFLPTSRCSASATFKVAISFGFLLELTLEDILIPLYFLFINIKILSKDEFIHKNIIKHVNYI